MCATCGVSTAWRFQFTTQGGQTLGNAERTVRYVTFASEKLPEARVIGRAAVPLG